MELFIGCGLFSAFWWGVFLFAFIRDRSRYRNCYLLFFALLSFIPMPVVLLGDIAPQLLLIPVVGVLLCLLIVPFFLMYNGVVMLRKEGHRVAHLLSLALGILIFAGEIAFAAVFLSGMPFNGPPHYERFDPAFLLVLIAYFSVSVIYGSMTFLIFILYTLFLQIIPKRRNFDFIIIHGAGLLDGDRVSKLLKDRLDKAVEVFRRAKKTPYMIPSGGKGDDESISEAAAMRDYLLSQGIPADRIIPEDRSKTTLENLKNSKQIIESMGGSRSTALVTSNYHVYRALRYCRGIGLQCTGIGSRVAFYYWPSALIREFIAIHTEKKHALIFAAGWLACIIAASVLVFS